MQYHKLTTPEPFCFEAGGSVEPFEIIYHTSPHEYHEGEKVIWICHALTANSDAEDWWPTMVGPGKLIDTDRCFVVCVNISGSAYGTTGPASTDPATGEPYYFSFPLVTVRDMARTFSIVRKHLGIKEVDLLVGSSIGGFQAFEWAVQEPDVIKNATFIATAPRISPWISAQVEAQRMALEADPSFRECKSLKGGANGLKCARAQALISYRSFEGYRVTQSEQDDDTLFAGRAASYERHQGDKLVNRGFDAYSYYYLCQSLDSHNLGRYRGGVAKALGSITASSIVVNIDTDGLFPPYETEEWAKQIPEAKYFQIHSEFGHDGFLLETEQLTKILSPLCKF